MQQKHRLEFIKKVKCFYSYIEGPKASFFMPVKIQNKVTLAIKQVKINEVKNYQSNLWVNVSQKDIFRLFEHFDINSVLDRGKCEKEDLEKILSANPKYEFNKLPDSVNWSALPVTEGNNQSLELVQDAGNLLPINTPKRNIIKANAAKIKPAISKVLKIDYIKYTIIGIIVSIATYFLYEYFKYKKW